MKYKVGDRVKIKSWDELINGRSLNCFGSISISRIDWSKENERCLLSDRIVIIESIDEDGDYKYSINGGVLYFSKEMIKEKVSDNTDLFQKYFDRGLTYYGALTSDPERITKQANEYAKECIKYVRL